MEVYEAAAMECDSVDNETAAVVKNFYRTVFLYWDHYFSVSTTVTTDHFGDGDNLIQ